MKRTVYIKAEFETVYLLNGVFSENLPVFTADADETTYLTVLPLKAALLPYTLKLAGGIPQNNRDLAPVYSLPGGINEITLKPRLNYVYSPQGVVLRNTNKDFERNLALRCFFQIKDGRMHEAKSLMSSGLKSMSDAQLTEFFSAYSDAIQNSYYPQHKNAVILIDNNGCGHIFDIRYENGLIDNFTEVLLT